MKECYLASMRGQEECSPWFKRFGHPTHHLIRVAVNENCHKMTIQDLCSGKGCGKTKGWTSIVLLQYLLKAVILKSIIIGEAIISLTKQIKFTQGNKVEEKRLIHRVVIDEEELDFLIQDCIKEGIYASSDKCLLGYITRSISLSTHICESQSLYKIENVSAFFKQAKQKTSHLGASQSSQSKSSADTSKFQCLHKIPSCTMCEAGGYYSTEAVKEFIKEVMVHYMNRKSSYLSCDKHKPFICAICFGKWHFCLGPWKNTSRVVTKKSEPLKEEKI
ncbi:5451_t:CDS:2 [Funneliformis geosporum]|uniref:5451_t:CDS:1 n=1 Tax=Funneliformis geosporum TaxID=1117311 RepID=A0A9W4T2C6_9GLOM|nr:5451_t:CDS:2 [Funneliformis geosporum]